MIATSIQPILAEPFLAAIIHALGTNPAAVLMPTPHVHLFKAMTGSITPQTPTTAFTECDFPGYAAVVLYPTVTGNFPNNAGLGVVQDCLYSASTSIVSPGQNALGYWIDDGTTNMYAAELFPSPVPFLNPYDFLALTVLIGALYASREQ